MVINVFLAVSSWFETCFLTLWQEHRLKVDGMMVLRRVFGNKERHNGEERKLRGMDLHNFHDPSILIKAIK
jgi:hypothetical protein